MTKTKQILSGIAAALLLLLAILAAQHAFNKVLTFRLLERIPLTEVLASTGGEVQLQGRVSAIGDPLISPDTKTPAVYYRYLIEVEETDSDGDKHWRTVHSSRKTINFYLKDKSGQAQILSNPALIDVDWSVAQKFRTRRGDRRYTEWRIDINDQVTVFGWLDLTKLELSSSQLNSPDLNSSDPVINFSHAGEYLPIISSFGDAHERSGFGWSAVLFLSLAVAALAFMSFFIVYCFSIHRILVFLSVITLNCNFLLLHYGWKSLEADVNAGFTRVNIQFGRSSQLIENLFRQHNLSWDEISNGSISKGSTQPVDLSSPVFADFSAKEKAQINGWRLAAWLVEERYQTQIDHFPENAYAKLKGLSTPTGMALPPAQLERANAALSNYQPTNIGQQLILTFFGLVITLAAAYLGFIFIRVKRIQENLPSCQPSGVSYGLTEVVGKLVPEDSDQLFTGPLSHEKCNWYHYLVKEKRGSGKNSHWVTITNDLKKQPFYCQDDDGRIRVFPTNAEVISNHVTTKREGRRTYRETRLMPGDDLYLLGRAVTDRARSDTLVLRHEKGSPYIISNKPESTVMLMKASRGMLALSASVSVMFFSLLLIAAGNGNFSSLDYLLAAMAAPLFLCLLMLIIMFNDLVFLRQRCRRAWANIQVSLKKRSSVVPNLEKIVSKLMDHERQLQTELAQLRTLSQQSNSAKAIDHYMSKEHSLLGNLQVTLEKYPDLKTDESLRDLHTRLVKLENEIAMLRIGFNDSVELYNTRVQKFPDNILAGIFSFKRLSLLDFDKAAHEIPTV